MVDVNLIYKVNPERLNNFAKGKTFDEFVDGLKSLPNFKIVNLMTNQELKQLYKLSTSENK